MKKHIFIFSTLVVCWCNIVLAQSEEDILSNIDSSKIESAKDFFTKSKWHFHSRTYFMSTINEGSLKDDYTLAQGAGLGLLTRPISGFQLGVSGYFIFNLVSSDLSKADAITNGNNRYEIGQYDITRPLNKSDLDRLEDLFLRYTYKKSNLTVGRFELQTPFVNMQDGRMRPTIEEGVWLSIKEFKKIGFNGGFIWAISPRSTVEWFKGGNSVGLYGQGVNVDGTKSNYKNNIQSKGLAIGNVVIKPFKKLEINIWDGYFENVMNTVFVEVKNEIKKSKIIFYQAIMFINQQAIRDGGNSNQQKTYINQGAISNSFSSQLGFKYSNINLNLNYTHVTDDGRYLMPREWGRDPFYTFMPRERNEGSGGVNAFTTNLNYSFKNNKFKAGLGYGFFKLPLISDFRLNKYSMPSYHQINLSSTYTFDKFWNGIDVRMLIASKIQEGQEKLNPIYVYNKVNLVNFSLIVDIKL